MSVVTRIRLIFYVRCIDCDPASFLLGSLINVRIVHERRTVRLCQHFRDGGGQRRLAMINVTNRSDIHVWLAAIKLFFSHDGFAFADTTSTL